MHAPGLQLRTVQPEVKDARFPLTCRDWIRLELLWLGVAGFWRRRLQGRPQAALRLRCSGRRNNAFEKLKSDVSFPEIVTRLPKVIRRPCSEQLRVGTIFSILLRKVFPIGTSLYWR